MASRVLIVEDDAIVANHLARTVRQMGYEVVGLFAAGEDAVNAAPALRPDVALMDVRLRGPMSGVDAADQLRRDLGLPVIYLTAYADDEVLGAARTTEPYGYLVKPVRDREIRASVEIALYKAQMDRRLQRLSEMLRAIRETSRLAAGAGDRQRLLDEACRILIRMRGCRLAWIAAPEATPGGWTVVARAGEGADYPEAARVAGGGRPPWDAELAAGRSVVHRHGEPAPDAAWDSPAHERGFASLAVVPLRRDGRVLGALYIHADRGDAFDDEEVELLQDLAGNLALGLANIEAEAARELAGRALDGRRPRRQSPADKPAGERRRKREG